MLGPLQPRSIPHAMPSIAQRLAKRHKLEERKQEYGNLDMATCFRLRRRGKASQKYYETCFDRSLQLFEVLIFLDVNNRFWHSQLVSEAIHGNRVIEKLKAELREYKVSEEI